MRWHTAICHLTVMARAVVFDTETTGLFIERGDRMIEVAAVELRDLLPTGAAFHAYVDPGRGVMPDATRVHGITHAMLKGRPVFNDIADGLLEFFGDDPLIAHNASFDFRVINAELARLDRPPLDAARKVDTMTMARKQFPGQPANLDALCRRFGVNKAERKYHSASMDVMLLAKVYLELEGGRQAAMELQGGGELPLLQYAAPAKRITRLVCVSPAEAAAHTAFLSHIKDPLWLS